MRKEKMIGKVHRKYTSERKNSLLSLLTSRKVSLLSLQTSRLPLAQDRLGIIPSLMIGRNVGDV